MATGSDPVLDAPLGRAESRPLTSEGPEPERVVADDGVPWLTASELSAWRNFSLMHVQLQAELARRLAEDGLSSADYSVLAALGDFGGGVRPNQLAHLLGWEKSRLSHQVARMERRGLVRREECPSDQRGHFIVKTDAGHAAIATVAPQHVRDVRELFVDLLSADELAVLDTISQRVMEHLPSDDA